MKTFEELREEIKKRKENVHHASEEQKAIFRERSKSWYWKNKEKKRLEEERRKQILASYNFPKAGDILEDDCCAICTRFSKVSGTHQGWCMRRKKSVNMKDICGEFDPKQEDEKFTQVIYRTPGIKNIRSGG